MKTIDLPVSSPEILILQQEVRHKEYQKKNNMSDQFCFSKHRLSKFLVSNAVLRNLTNYNWKLRRDKKLNDYTRTWLKFQENRMKIWKLITIISL